MEDKIIEILDELCPFEEIDEDTLLIEMNVLDSLTIVMLIERLEQEFMIEIQENEVVPENFLTVKTIAEMIQKYI